MNLRTPNVAVRTIRVCLLSSFFIMIPFVGSANGQAGSVFVNDAKVQEPASGTVDMVFTVTLAAPATGNASVNFQTSDGTANAGTCGAGGDYTNTNGTVNFATGDQVKTINVPICSDAVNDPNETLIVNLTGPNNITIVDNQATGTITGPPPAGTVLISELRHFGPGAGNDPNDEFIEIYNNTNAPLTVAASDASAGYGVFRMGADCNATPVLVGIIPNATIIPARGHFLITGTAYSLANYGGTGAAAGNLTVSAELPANSNIGIFSTSNPTLISSVNRLDAVGFGVNVGGVCNLLREGPNEDALAANLTSLGQHSYFRKLCDFVGSACTTPGTSKDTNNNANDFMFVDPNVTSAGPQPRLGAAGPENISSPLKRDATIAVRLLDSTKSSAVAPNRVRDTTPGDPNYAALGTLSARRRVVNNTGAPVTRLRFRAVELTTAPSPGPLVADVRLISSTNLVGVGPVSETATCTASGAAPPCTVTVQALTLEQPPTQPLGGGLNSTLSVTLGTPLAPGASINVDFKLGVMATGSYRFLIIVEALP